MNFDTIFTAKKEHLRQLDSTGAVDLFRELLRAEALKVSPGTCKFNVPRQINVQDGGIDGTVDAARLVTQSNLIAPGKNGYQIKSGKTFEPWQKSEIQKELFGDRTPLNRENLGKNIHACLKDNGTYVLVCTGINLSKSQTEQARSHIEKYLIEQCEYEHPKVKVWSQGDLINFLDEFPLLVLGLRELLEAKLKPHWRWSRVSSMQVPFVSGQSQEKLIAKIRCELRRSDRAAFVPVWGDPGVGKTRLVLEATRTDDLSPLVIYCDSASQFESSVLMSAICSDDNLSAIVAIDGCEPLNQIRIWDELKNQGSRIKFVTISNNYDNIPEVVSDCEILPLSNEQTSKIIQHHRVPKIQADRHANLCSGSPLMADHVGKALAHSSGDASKVLSQDTIYQSFYVDFGSESLGSPEVQQKELVLQHIALFKRFGFKDPVSCESQAIAKKVKDVNSQITPKIFRKIVKNLRKHGILKGDYTLNITPKALHIKLWVDCWEIYYDDEFDFEEFTEDLTPELIEWFCEMFVYARESESALTVVKDLLGSKGPFRKSNGLETSRGSNFFLVLTVADPRAALECLEETIGTWNRETLSQFKKGRWNVVSALEKIAMYGEWFARAARLLLALGGAENGGISSDVCRTFASLFSLGIGELAPTGTSPSRRFPILEETFEYGSKEQRALALRACDVVLTPRSSCITYGTEYQGLRKEPKRWSPRSFGEISDALRQVWKLLEKQLTHLPEDEQKKGAIILLKHARGIGTILNLSDMVVNTVTAIAKIACVDKKQVIKIIDEILFYDGKDLRAETRERWGQLMDGLVGSGFHSMMKRYVGIDLLQDKFDEDRNRIDQVQPRIEELAQQAVDTPSLLQSELYWLVTVEAKKGFRFGDELGKRDDGFSLLPMLLDAQRNAGENASVSLLGGYFRAIFESDSGLWEKQLDALSEDTTLSLLIPLLTRSDGLTNRAALRLLDLAKRDIIGVNHFEIFIYSNTIENLSDEVFTKWIEFLLSTTGRSAVPIALQLYHDYYFQKPDPPLPPDLSFRLLSHPSLFEESDTSEFDDTVESNWVEISKAFLHLYPEKRFELVELMLSHFGKHGAIVGVYLQTCSVLDEITKRHPVEVWVHVSKLLEDRTDVSRIDSLEQWLREGSFSAGEDATGVLTRIPREKIWEWVDVENRVSYLTPCVPKVYSAEEWETSLARELLVRYGTRKNGGSILVEIFSIRGGYGLPSLQLKGIIQTLLQIRDREDNEHVRSAIDESVKGFEEQIKRERLHEERRFC